MKYSSSSKYFKMCFDLTAFFIGFFFMVLSWFLLNLYVKAMIFWSYLWCHIYVFIHTVYFWLDEFLSNWFLSWYIIYMYTDFEFWLFVLFTLILVYLIQSLDFTGRRKSPPPQRPSSPAAIIRIQSANHQHSTTRPSSALHVKVGSDWLAGGRDIFWENIQKRPRSGHVPGWKEGLPESMKRPRSAVANRTLRSGAVSYFSHKVHHVACYSSLTYHG